MATKLFTACYPLHPVTLLVLITLCQKFAQNERTLFTYLGSLEPHGLRHSLANLKPGQWLYPDNVYDYFIQNQSAVLSDPLTHRRWVEVITAIERAEELGKQQQAIAKTIGLLNLVSGTEGLKASPDILSTLFRLGNEVKTILRPLVDASIIQYRKFNDEYRVWQGTDFDISEAVQLEIQKRDRVTKVRARLANLKNERVKAPRRLTKAKKELSDSDNEIARHEELLADISKKLKGINLQDIAERERRRDELYDELRDIDRNIGALTSRNENTKRESIHISNKINDLAKKDKQTKIYSSRRKVCENIKVKLEQQLVTEEKQARGVSIFQY